MTPELWKAMVGAAQAKFPLSDAEVPMVDLIAYTNELQALQHVDPEVSQGRPAKKAVKHG